MFPSPQMRGGPVHGPHQSEAAVHPDPEPGQRSPGVPARGEHVQRRVHRGAQRRAAGPAPWTAEPAGELRQYLHHLPARVSSSATGFVAESWGTIWNLTKHKARASGAPLWWGAVCAVNQPSSFHIAPLLKGLLSFFWKVSFSLRMRTCPLLFLN